MTQPKPNTIRVITGSARGTKLRVPHEARPISDRAKSSLFSVIGSDIVNKKILDLFAGSGTLGIESLSRGAEHCTFVDADRYAAKDIRFNLEKTHLLDKSTIRRQKALHFLNDQPQESFDIVFMDPPFDFYGERGGRTAHLLEEVERVIPPGGGIILKHPKDLKLPELDALELADSRNFGASTVTIWVKMLRSKKSSDL